MRFAQPDTVIPELHNPQALNRYSYIYNSPIYYSDPTGHRPIIDDNEDGNPIVDTSWRPGDTLGGKGGKFIQTDLTNWLAEEMNRNAESETIQEIIYVLDFYS